MIGHDFYEGQRQGSKGYPRFTDPELRGPEGYADFVKMACSKELERCGADKFDLLMLHNPDNVRCARILDQKTPESTHDSKQTKKAIHPRVQGPGH